MMTRRVGAANHRGAANLLSTANAGTTDRMARRKATPDRTMIVREQTIAPSRRQRGDGDEVDEPKPETKAEAKPDAKPDVKPDARKPRDEDTAPMPVVSTDPKKPDAQPVK